jgi:hypothetical protein
MEFTQRIDFAVDLLGLVLISIAVILVWQIFKAIGAVRDVGIRLARDLESSNERLETARENVSRLNDEIHAREIAALDRRLKALEDRRADKTGD